MVAIEPGTTLFGFGLAAYEITMIVVMVRLERRSGRPRRWSLSQRTVQMRLVLVVAFVAVGLGGLGLIPVPWRNSILGAAVIVLVVVVLADWVRTIVRAVRRRHAALPPEETRGYPDRTGGLRALRVLFSSFFLSLLLFLLMLTSSRPGAMERLIHYGFPCSSALTVPSVSSSYDGRCCDRWMFDRPGPLQARTTPACGSASPWHSLRLSLESSACSLRVTCGCTWRDSYSQAWGWS
jgi:hypothetical protein